MSWEVVRSETVPCPCGHGTVTLIVEMDDWNRLRNHRMIDCAVCLKAENQRQQDTEVITVKQSDLYSKAKALAADRYLEQWLSRYSGLTKKQVWRLFTGGSGYPSLATFYKHIQNHGSVSNICAGAFLNDFEESLRSLGVKDRDIGALLSERAQLSISVAARP